MPQAATGMADEGEGIAVAAALLVEACEKAPRRVVQDLGAARRPVAAVRHARLAGVCSGGALGAPLARMAGAHIVLGHGVLQLVRDALLDVCALRKCRHIVRRRPRRLERLGIGSKTHELPRAPLGDDVGVEHTAWPLGRRFALEPGEGGAAALDRWPLSSAPPLLEARVHRILEESDAKRLLCDGDAVASLWAEFCDG